MVLYITIMNRILHRNLSRKFGNFHFFGPQHHKLNERWSRSVNTNSGSDSMDRLVKAKLTFEDGSVFEG